jgi:DUF1365 family protein
VNFRSGLYVGSVLHHRLRPRPHRLRQRAFWMLIDLDEIDTLDRKLWLFSHNRCNATSFHDADHGDSSPLPLRGEIDRLLAGAGLATGGAIQLLCMPRVLGYGFNPLSIYFCHDRSGALAVIVYQVHNTFGERHSYLIPVDGGASADVRQRCAKTFYVSPFIAMDMTYDFHVGAPNERLTVAIRVADRDGMLMVAALAGMRRPLTDGALLRLLFSHPLLTLKVTAAIHWHALRLWWKGIPLYPRPQPRAATHTDAGDRKAA